jgi:hypothetical protein
MISETSKPAQPCAYAFWPAHLDLNLTGQPPSCKDLAPPLDALRPHFVKSMLLRYVLPIAKAVLLPGFFRTSLGISPLMKGSFMRRGGREGEGQVLDEIIRIGLKLDKRNTGNHTIEC